MKQVIVIRKDLRASAGKMVAHGAHASLLAYQCTSWWTRWRWALEGQKKIVVRAETLGHFMEVASRAEAAGLPYSVVKDAGRTTFSEPTLTAIGIGPARDEDVDAVTGSLRLL